MKLEKTLVEKFIAARIIGTPLISITTADQEVTIQKISAATNAVQSSTPIIQWDCIRGWKARNGAGASAIANLLERFEIQQEATKNPLRMMALAEHLPRNSILFVMNAHHRTHNMERPDFWQAFWNLRDIYKSDFRTAVILSPQITLPIDVASDVLVLEETLPNEKELLEIVEEITKLTSYQYSKANKQAAAQALLGLSPFAAEQAVALALKKGEINVSEIHLRKRELLNDIPGLKVYSGSENFDSLGGCGEVKTVLSRILNGKEPPKVIVFIDEGEKMMAGATHSVGDNTGISQDFMGTLLTYMEDHESDGTIFVGPTGTAKSALAKAMGNEADVPTVFLDLGSMKNSLVGASEHRLRYALKVIDTIGHGKAFFIMTSNNIDKIPPEFKRRFSSGTFFFDIPTKESRAQIWKIHTEKYGIDASQIKKVNDEGWTGAEIRNCCRMAYRQNITLQEAAQYIVPVSVSGAEAIKALRRAATNNFLSADYPGTYRGFAEDVEAPVSHKSRKLAGTQAA